MSENNLCLNTKNKNSKIKYLYYIPLRYILGILFIVAMMFGTYEYVALLGIIFFIASVYYASIETNENSKYIVAKDNEEIVGFAGILILGTL